MHSGQGNGEHRRGKHTRAHSAHKRGGSFLFSHNSGHRQILIPTRSVYWEANGHLKMKFLKKIIFIYSWETQRERQRHRQREKQAPCREPNAGLDPRTPGSWPEPKADAQPRYPSNGMFIIPIEICSQKLISSLTYLWHRGRWKRDNMTVWYNLKRCQKMTNICVLHNLVLFSYVSLGNGIVSLSLSSFICKTG